MNVFSVPQNAPSSAMKVFTEAFTVDPNIREQYNAGYESFKSVMIRNYMDLPSSNLQRQHKRKRGNSSTDNPFY